MNSIAKLVITFSIIFTASMTFAKTTMLMNLNQAQSRIRFSEIVHFQSGVFEINNTGTRVLSKCIKTSGDWIRVNYLYQDCAIDLSTREPSVADKLKTGSMPNDEPYFLFRHFGIDGRPSTNYNEWNKMRNPGNSGNYYGDLKNVFGIGVTSNEFKWSIDTRYLPDRMRLEIPGAGIHAHIGESFSARGFNIFSSQQSRLRILLKMKVARYILKGEGKSNMTIGVTFHVPDVDGNPIPLTLNVSLVELPGINLVEGTSTDSRSLFARTNLDSNSTFISHIRGSKFSGPSSSFKNYEFEINYNNLMNLIGAMSADRVSQGLSRLSTNVSQIRFRGVNLKNEYTHLENSNDNAITTFKVKSFSASVINP